MTSRARLRAIPTLAGLIGFTPGLSLVCDGCVAAMPSQGHRERVDLTRWVTGRDVIGWRWHREVIPGDLMSGDRDPQEARQAGFEVSKVNRGVRVLVRLQLMEERVAAEPSSSSDEIRDRVLAS